MSLCYLCEQITPWSLKRIDVSGTSSPPSHLCNPHYKTLHLLEASASTCPLCQLFCNALLNSVLPTQKLDFNASVHLALIKHPHRDRKVREPQLSELMLSCGEVFVKMNAVAEEGSQAASEKAVAGRRPSEPGESEGLDSIAEWFQTCVQEHGVCRIGGEKGFPEKEEVVELPHRVLNVDGMGGDEDFICLIETENGGATMPGQYVALSHRWPVNPTEHFMTTKEVIEQRKRKIKLTDLPANYRDAVIVTRTLGLKYLWIDSLCIVQDDAADWEREAALMGSIYHNSTVTVMAATSVINENGGRKNEMKTSSNGFLGKRKARNKRAGVKLKYIDEHWVETGDYWEILEGSTIPLDELELLSRGWVMQEEMLSRRRIIYKPDQSVWYCNVKSIQEINRRVSYDAASTKTDGGFIDHWLGLVERYSERNLTYESDKLPALSGLATHFSELHKQNYFAGIFSGAVAETLLWRSKIPGGLKKPKQYVAPSWSWVGPNGWIKMVAPHQPSDSQNQSGLKSVLEDVKFELRSEIQDSPYGRLNEGGLLRTRGLVKDACIKSRENDDGNSPTLMRLVADGKLMSNFYLDFCDDLDRVNVTSRILEWKVKCLWVLKESDHVLILRAVRGEIGQYERIAIAIIDPAWFELGGFRREQISII